MATKKQLADAKKLLAQAEARQKDLDAQLAKVNQIAATVNTSTTAPADPDIMKARNARAMAATTAATAALTPQEKAAKQTADAQAAAVKPVLTAAEEAAGFTIQWVRTGVAGAGEWRKIKPASVGVSAGGGTGGGTGGGNRPEDTTSQNATLVSTETDEYGNVVGVYSDGTTKVLVPSGRKYKSTVDLDAYALLEETFKAYGLETLVPKIKTYMERGLGSNQAALQLKTEPEYVERFRGNEIRRATGLNVLSEGEYLALEDAYSQTLRAYGLQNYFGIDRKAKTASMADIIGNDIDATEFRDRIDTVVTRVQNADPNIKATLRGFYNITDTDLVKYFLNPKENLPKLQEKVTAAEIGSEFIKQGLVTGVLSAEEFAKLGIDKAAAAKGAETIATILPEGTKLGKIYAEEGIDYTQKTAEEEVFKGLASAERKRRQLTGREVASFSGASGVSKSAFGSATGGAF